ncbi:MAG: hypothetical protein M0D54_10460 [Hyphomonadaceae bacterium JAD_PAG50586_4]|nr:MAG: hypothetical protein M0D54_10460 [Hyphomonadaceae bacterium JAD_PAG50586_4]
MADIAAHTAASDAPRPRLSQAALVLLQTALAQKEHVFVGQSFEARPSRTPLVYGRHGVFAPALNDDDEGQGQTLSPLDYGDACSHAVVYGRDVSAAIIELAERNATSHGAVGAAGFVLSGAIIIGAIDLVNARAAFPIRIVNCFVPDGIVFHHGAFGSIDLDSSIVGPINAVLAKFDGSVRLAHAKFLGPVDFGAATVAKVLDLRDCVIAPARPLARGQSAPIDRALMNLSMSDIGEARFNGALICGGIVMLSAKVRGHVYFRDACVLSPEALCHAFAGPVADRFGRPVAKFSPARFAHAVTHGIEEIVADDAEALATIPSLISKLIATVSALERRVAALDQAEPLQPATSAEAFAAWIERFCQDSDVFPSALRAEAAVIGGSFSLRNATISGGVNLSNAQFDGGIRLDGAYLAWPLASPYDRPAILRAVHARVGERVEFHHDPGTRTQAGEFTPARILGTIDFSSLRVGGDANLSHTIFGSSVVLRGAEIGGALTFLRSVFALCGDAERAIDAQGVRVGGDIAWGVRAAHELADAATFSTAGERAPSAIVVTRADVGGDLLYPFAVSDHVAFLGRDLRVAGTIAFLPRQRSARAPQPPPRSPDALAHAWSEIIADQRAWSGGALIALALAACALAFARLDLALAAVGSWFGLRLLFASVRPIQRTWRLLTRVFGLGPSTQAPARRLEIDLMHARCSTFEAGFGAWPNPGSLVLEGLHFNSLGASGPFRQWPLPAAERHERRLTSVLLLAPRAWHRLWKLLAGRPLRDCAGLNCSARRQALFGR